MTAAAETSAIVSLRDVERELSQQLKAAQGPGEEPVQRARMSNLVIFCASHEQAARISADLPAIVAVHPARVLMLIGDDENGTRDLKAQVTVRHHRVGKTLSCTEQVTLHAHGTAVAQLPFAVRSLLIGDLPTNLYWAAPSPPPMSGPLLQELAEEAQQIIFDSIGWREPARGVVATGSWVDDLERTSTANRWRVASDLNWRRLKYWRRLLAQALDPVSAPGVIESISEIHIEHGPHAVIQAWELIAWLSSRLHWQVLTGRVQPAVAITWRFLAPQGDVRVRMKRLEEGPPEIRRMHINCYLEGVPSALHLVVEEDRLAMILEGRDAAPRTMNRPQHNLVELVGRQLSDRERDPVFYESLGVAQSLARSVLT